jgi:hypothetical protein
MALSNQGRAGYGSQAVRTGTPNNPQVRRDVNLADISLRQQIAETITNILHFADSRNIEIDNTVSVAKRHFEEQR